MLASKGTYSQRNYRFGSCKAACEPLPYPVGSRRSQHYLWDHEYISQVASYNLLRSHQKLPHDNDSRISSGADRSQYRSHCYSVPPASLKSGVCFTLYFSAEQDRSHSHSNLISNIWESRSQLSNGVSLHRLEYLRIDYLEGLPFGNNILGSGCMQSLKELALTYDPRWDAASIILCKSFVWDYALRLRIMYQLHSYTESLLHSTALMAVHTRTQTCKKLLQLPISRVSMSVLTWQLVCIHSCLYVSRQWHSLLSMITIRSRGIFSYMANWSLLCISAQGFILQMTAQVPNWQLYVICDFQWQLAAISHSH